MPHCLLLPQTHPKMKTINQIRQQNQLQPNHLPANSEPKHSVVLQPDVPKLKPSKKRNCVLKMPSHGQRMATPN